MCRRKIEMSPGVQSRNDAPSRRTRFAPNGMSAESWVKATPGATRSVAAIPAWRLNAGKCLQVEVDDRL